MIKAITGFAVALILSGCAASLPPPTYVDSFHGYLNASSSSVPADRPLALSEPLGLIFSENVERYLKHMQAGDAGLKSYGIFTNTNAVADLDPKFAAGRVLMVLRKRYPGIVLIDDFNEAVATKKKGVLLVDIRPILGERSGQATTVTITVYAFNEKMQPISKFTGQGSSIIPYPAWDFGLQPAIDAAVRQLDEKLTALSR